MGFGGTGDPGCLDIAGLFLRHDAPRVRPRHRRLADPLERSAPAILRPTDRPSARSRHRPTGEVRRWQRYALELYRYHARFVPLAGRILDRWPNDVAVARRIQMSPQIMTSHRIEEVSMFDHVSIGVRNLARAKQFYNAALHPLVKPSPTEGRAHRGIGE